MSPTRSAARRSTVSVAALLGAAALLFSSIGPATAAPSPTNIDLDGTGSITIHKFAEPATPGDGDHRGNQLDLPEDMTPLEGVEFTISKFDGIDLATAAGWEQLGNVTVDSEMPKTEIKTVTTDADGTAGSGELELGLYLVTETGVGDNNVIKRSDPFLVSVPNAGTNNEWLYDVHAYPKNSVVTIDMTVDENDTFGLNNGPIDWTITTSVPRLPANAAFESYELRVTLDERLALPDDELQDVRVRIGDYEGSLGDVGARVQDGEVIISSSDPGVLQLLSARQGERVSIMIPSRIISNDIAGGSIRNTATISVNNSRAFPAEARTDWGAVKVIVRASGASEGLGGGIYEVRSPNGEPLVINDVQEFRSNDNGEVIIPGLRAGDGYSLAEIQAPPGYAQMDQPVQFNVTAAGTGEVEGAASREDHPNVVVIDKAQVSGFVLPITGSFGSLPFILAGLLLVATALIVNRSRRRRLARAV